MNARGLDRLVSPPLRRGGPDRAALLPSAALGGALRALPIRPAAAGPSLDLPAAIDVPSADAAVSGPSAPAPLPQAAPLPRPAPSAPPLRPATPSAAGEPAIRAVREREPTAPIARPTAPTPHPPAPPSAPGRPAASAATPAKPIRIVKKKTRIIERRIVEKRKKTRTIVREHRSEAASDRRPHSTRPPAAPVAPLPMRIADARPRAEPAKRPPDAPAAIAPGTQPPPPRHVITAAEARRPASAPAPRAPAPSAEAPAGRAGRGSNGPAAVSAGVAPRAPRPAPIAAVPAPAPNRAMTAPRAAVPSPREAPPQISVEIGRIEIVAKSAPAPRTTRTPARRARAHAIDPGFAFRARP